MSFADPPPPYTESPAYSSSRPPPQPSQNVSLERDASGRRRRYHFGEYSRSTARASTADTLPLQPPYDAGHGAAPFPDTTSSAGTGGEAGRPSATTLTHRLNMGRGGAPRREDFPYPDEWAPSRDVTARDWDTFVGFLVGGAGGGERDEKGLEEERRRGMEGMMRQWNERFFGPRGVDVVIAVDDGRRGNHDGAGSSYDGPSNYHNYHRGHHDSHHNSHFAHHHPASWPHQPTTYAPLPPRPNHRTATNGTTGSSASNTSTATMSSKDRWKEKLGRQGVRLDSGSVSWGDRFSLDARKMRIGSVEVGDRGLLVGGRKVDVVGELLGSGGGHRYQGGGAGGRSYRGYHHAYAPPSGPPPPPAASGYAGFGAPPQVSGTTGPLYPAYSYGRP